MYNFPKPKHVILITNLFFLWALTVNLQAASVPSLEIFFSGNIQGETKPCG